LNTPLAIDFVEQGRLVLVRLQGPLDEESRLAERTPAFTGRKLVLNLQGISRVSAPGLRDWVRWVQRLETDGNSLHLVGCSPAVMSQATGVRNFCGETGHLISFQAPYFCRPCHGEHAENVLSSMLSTQGALPTAICHRCSEAMEFDAPPEIYRSLIRDHASRAVDPDVLAAIQRFGDGHLATAVATLQEISAGKLSSPSRYLTPHDEE